MRRRPDAGTTGKNTMKITIEYERGEGGAVARSVRVTEGGRVTPAGIDAETRAAAETIGARLLANGGKIDLGDGEPTLTTKR